MHGSIRFVLAILVALSHLGITFYGYNMGVAAVVIFYILAGMVSYKLIHNYYPNQPLLYYKDRLLRILPLYFLVLILSYCIYLAGAKSYFISEEPNFIAFVSNIFIIPLSYFMYSHIDKFTLVPPVWSLGVELQFYILAPFILTRRKFLLFFLLLSLLVYILAAVGVLHTDYFGYRLLLGVLFIFLLGGLIHSQNRILLVSVYLLLVLTAVYISIIGYKAPYNYETIFALLVGLPLLKYSLNKKLRPISLIVIDKYLGRLSYAVFLLHFPVLWLVNLSVYFHQNLYIILFLTLILSMLALYLESYITKRLQL